MNRSQRLQLIGGIDEQLRQQQMFLDDVDSVLEQLRPWRGATFRNIDIDRLREASICRQVHDSLQRRVSHLRRKQRIMKLLAR